MKLYIANIEDDDTLTNYREIDLQTAIYIIMKSSNNSYSIIDNMINNLGVVYWYTDNYVINHCIIDIDQNICKTDYDINIYNQLKKLLREDKIKLLGI
jgi:hypothetical protein